METYDFQSKAQYRVRVWSEIDKVCSVPKALRTVVYLDTREALETLFLLERGYKPENLLAVNREPVEVALLTGKLKKAGLPTVRTAGVEWQRAVADFGAAHIVNFDGTGCLHPDLMNLLKETVRMARPRALAFNMLGGREQARERALLSSAKEWRGMTPGDELPSVTSFGKLVNANHGERMRTALQSATDVVASECLFHVVSVAWDVYTSASRQPMVWCVAGLRPHSSSDKSWRKVERKWCLAPNCFHLSDPNSYRSLRAEYGKLAEALAPISGMSFGQASALLNMAPERIDALLERAKELRSRMQLMDSTNHITSDFKRAGTCLVEGPHG